MCCFMQNILAQTLADFEVKLEKDVLEPLNKLSEVTVCVSLASFSHISSMAFKSTKNTNFISNQEDLPEILKNKKQFAKLTTDWHNARTR